MNGFLIDMHGGARLGSQGPLGTTPPTPPPTHIAVSAVPTIASKKKTKTKKTRVQTAFYSATTGDRGGEERGEVVQRGKETRKKESR